MNLNSKFFCVDLASFYGLLVDKLVDACIKLVLPLEHNILDGNFWFSLTNASNMFQEEIHPAIFLTNLFDVLLFFW